MVAFTVSIISSKDRPSYSAHYKSNGDGKTTFLFMSVAVIR